MERLQKGLVKKKSGSNSSEVNQGITENQNWIMCKSDLILLLISIYIYDRMMGATIREPWKAKKHKYT